MYVIAQRSSTAPTIASASSEQRVAVVRARRARRAAGRRALRAAARRRRVRSGRGSPTVITIATAGEPPRGGQPALVGLQEAEQSVEGTHSCTVNEYCRSALGGPGRGRARGLSWPHVQSRAGTDGRGARAGLCDSCLHQQLVRNTRGSSFSLCLRSRTDPTLPPLSPHPGAGLPGLRAARLTGSARRGLTGSPAGIDRATSPSARERAGRLAALLDLRRRPRADEVARAHEQRTPSTEPSEGEHARRRSGCR